MKKLHKIVATTAVASTVALGFSQIADADTYTVKSGDTLWNIAVNNGTTVEKLMQDNHLTSSLIFPGDQLSYGTVNQRVAQAKGTGTYKVVLGDTLAKIANQFGITVNKIVELNNLQNPNLILVGQELKVSETVISETPTTSVVKETKKTVEEVAKTAVTKATTDSKEEVAKVAAEKKAAEDAAAKVVAEKKAAEDAAAKAAAEKKAAEAAAAKTAAEKKAAEAAAVKTTTTAQTTAVATSSNKAAAIYQAALAQIGMNQDCTMLVTNALKSVGINFHDWPVGYMSLGTVVSASEAIPGDLVYYANGGTGWAHIAVYAGNGQAVHGGWLGNQTVLNTANVGSGAVYIRVR